MIVPTAPSVPAPVATRTPVPSAETTEAAAPAAARNVVERYYALIDRGDYAAAYRLWADDGRASNQTLAAFTTGFARTASTSVTAGVPTDAEGAAGHAYVTVPVTVEAALKDGTRQRFAGRYILSRVNDVDGSTAEQRRWHLFRATLHTAPAA